MTAASHESIVELLHYVASILVDKTDEVQVESEAKEDGGLHLKLRVANDDIGKIIGKQGRTARALRNLIGAAAHQRSFQVTVEFVDA